MTARLIDCAWGYGGHDALQLVGWDKWFMPVQGPGEATRYGASFSGRSRGWRAFQRDFLADIMGATGGMVAEAFE